MPSSFEAAPTGGRLIVKAWRSKKVGGTYGLRVYGVKKKDRTLYFPRSWSQVEIEIDGVAHTFLLRETFWGKCPEIRGPAIEEWLKKLNALAWAELRPPKFELLILDAARFRLIGG